MEINTRNANTLFSDMFRHLSEHGVPSGSRNGRVLRFPEPVLTTVRNPAERVLLHRGRDANPVFHLMEAIWMLAGRQDVAFLSLFNSTIHQYSDDGQVFNAAYGYRWREHFGVDQLAHVIHTLEADPGSRQAVIQMWDAGDLVKQTKDKACNTQLMFEILDGALNMTVINRSNDMYYGYCGANIVHMTILQEFVASALGVKLGAYRTFSTNLHLYLDLYDAQKYVAAPPVPADYDCYSNAEKLTPLPMMLNGDWFSFLDDCEKFCRDPFDGSDAYAHPFFLGVAHPMAMVSRVRKARAGTGEGWADKVRAPDWRRAVFHWIQARESKKQSVSASSL